MTNVIRSALSVLLMFAAALVCAQPVSEYSPPAGRQVIEKAFPNATELQPMDGNRAVQEVYAGDELIGYAYQSLDFVQTPAYSGKPLNAMVVLDTTGEIRAAKVIHHDEPILLVGIPESKMHEFTDQYTGLKADQRVTVGGTSTERKVAVDGLQQ